jgi:hypothetical protein
MKITQYMKSMLPCTALYPLIRVTFSTPTPVIANNLSQGYRTARKILAVNIKRLAEAMGTVAGQSYSSFPQLIRADTLPPGPSATFLNVDLNIRATTNALPCKK